MGIVVVSRLLGITVHVCDKKVAFVMDVVMFMATSESLPKGNWEANDSCQQGPRVRPSIAIDPRCAVQAARVTANLKRSQDKKSIASKL